MIRAVRALAATALLGAAPALAEPIDRARLERARDAIFARREFTYGKPVGESRIARMLTDFIESVATLQEEYPLTFWVVMALLLLMLAVLLAHIVWTIRAARRAEFENELGLDGRLELDRSSSAEFRSRALASADAGRFEEAVRDLYLALLLELDRRGALHFASHKALLDYRHEVAGDPSARHALQALGGTYLPTSFGRRPLDRAHFDELVGVLDDVTAAADARVQDGAR